MQFHGLKIKKMDQFDILIEYLSITFQCQINLIRPLVILDYVWITFGLTNKNKRDFVVP